MKHFLFAFLIFSSINCVFGFEGTLNISLLSDKKELSSCEVKVKDTLVYIKQKTGANYKYDYFILNLKSGELNGVSTAEKKIILKFNLTELLSYYESRNLINGYKQNYGGDYKVTDKYKTVSEIATKKYTAETDVVKATIWAGECSFPINQLIPLLRLFGNWNEADGSFKNCILETEAFYKISKKTTTVKVSVAQGTVKKETFILPKDFVQKDFQKIMNGKSKSDEMDKIVKSFCGF
jgi:hypothetical protein